MKLSSRPVRVLHVLPSLQQSYGGPIRAVLDLSARAEKHGLRSEVLGFGEQHVPDNPLGSECIHTLPITSPRSYCHAPRLRDWLRSNLKRFDGVVLHGMWLYPNFAVADECVHARLPYACFPHGMLEPWAVYRQSRWKAAKKLVYWHLRERNIFNRAQCVYFTTQREQVLAEQTFHLGGVQRLLIPYGAGEKPERMTHPANLSLSQPPNRKVALFLGRLHPKKNVHFLLNVWKEANPPDPWHLVIAGSGDENYTRRLRNSVKENGLAERVHLVGFVTGQDKSYLLQRSSWFLLPSLQENFGIAVVEAISNGCPVAISTQVFLADTLHPKSEVLPLDRQAWVDFMQQRMVDDCWRSTVAALDKAQVAEKWNVDKVSRDWAETLSETFG